MIKECFIDTETTGVDTSCSGIWQIGGIIRQDRKIVEEFEFECDIFTDDKVTSDALSMAGLTIDDLNGFPDPLDIYEQLIVIFNKYVDKFDKSDKMFFIGYGAEFDAKILRRWFEGFGDKYFGSWFWHPWICVMTLAMHYMMPIRHTMENFTLQVVAEKLGIKIDKTKFHQAYYDSFITMQIYDKLSKGGQDFR